MIADPLADAVVAWQRLTNNQQIEFVLMFERDLRDALVYAGTLDPPVTPAWEEEELFGIVRRKENYK